MLCVIHNVYHKLGASLPAMTLTIQAIEKCASDDELYKLIAVELERRLKAVSRRDFEGTVRCIRVLPAGLRAMAASYELDVSVTLDDLGWHFANWHHRDYCDETLAGLKELEAGEVAELFERAYATVLPYWDKVTSLLAKDFDKFSKWYSRSQLEKDLMPLNQRMWAIHRELPKGLFSYWLGYARKYPSKLVHVNH